MGKGHIIEKLEKEQLKQDLPDFRVGDKIRVHHRIIEGEKERIQVLEGTVMARSGSGLSASVRIHRIAYSVVMEFFFLIHSSRVVKIEVMKKGRVRRSKLTYLRGKKGKAAKVRGQIAQKKKKPKEAVTTDGAETKALAEPIQTEPVVKEENLPAEVAPAPEPTPVKE